jgi:hypothetical protein
VGRKQGRIEWAAEKSFQFLNKDLSSKVKDLNIFNLDSNWIETRINLNKLFEGFSNLELFKISLNIQIQTKALNRRLLKRFEKRFQK